LKRDTEACSAEGHPRNSLAFRSEQIRSVLSSRCRAGVILLSTAVAKVVHLAQSAIGARPISRLSALGLMIGKWPDRLILKRAAPEGFRSAAAFIISKPQRKCSAAVMVR